MKKDKIIFWITTFLIAFMMLGSGLANAMVNESSIQFLHKELGYPVYFIGLIGIAKVLGAIALLVPGFPRLKEWAYAGIAFDLLGAVYSIIAIGGTVDKWIFILLPLALLTVSYIYYHKIHKSKAL